MTTHTITNLVFPPNPTAERLQVMRNILACQLASARMLATKAPYGTNMILGLAVHGMLQYRFWLANHTLPRDTDLLAALDELDHPLADLARHFQAETDLGARWLLAEQIVEATIETCECIKSEPLAPAV